MGKIKILILFQGGIFMGLRKRQIRLLFILLLCVFAYTTWTVYSGNQSKLSNDDFIRFHVIANSNSIEDQNLKLMVRDGVLAKINSELVLETMSQHNAMDMNKSWFTGNIHEDGQKQETASLNQEAARQYINDNLPEIKEVAEKIIQENGYCYTANAELGVKWIPEKTYGDLTFPSGNYEALNITIGEGMGENWWCVLFPPLCLIGLEPLNMDQNSLEANDIYKEILIDEKYDELMKERDKPTTLKIKFKTLELIDDLNK